MPSLHPNLPGAKPCRCAIPPFRALHVWPVSRASLETTFVAHTDGGAEPLWAFMRRALLQHASSKVGLMWLCGLWACVQPLCACAHMCVGPLHS